MSNFKIGGLASGMDTQSIVDQLMRVERMPLDKMMQKKQTLEWQRDDYREINRKLQEFRRYLSDNFARQATLNAKTVNSSNSNRVTATARADAGNSSFTISKVTQLATAATNFSAGKIGGSQKINPNTRLFNFSNEKIKVESPSKNFQLSGGVTGITSIKVGNEVYENSVWDQATETFTLTNGTKTVQIKQDGSLEFSEDVNSPIEVRRDLFGANMTSVDKKDTIKVSSSSDKFSLSKAGIADVTSIKVGSGNYINSGSHSFANDGKMTFELQSDSSKKVTIYEDGRLEFSDPVDKDKNIEVNYKYTQGSFSITTYNKNGEAVKKDFTFDGSTTLNQIMSEVNRSGAGVNMFYDEQSDKISITRTETGNFNVNGDGKEMKFTGDFLTNILRLDSSKEEGGQNVKFTINGLETERTTNSFTINGVDITLKDTFTDNPVTINVSTDVDKVVDSVKEFIEKYNEMIDLINGKLTEERFRSFKPLSDEQKSAMSEKEVEMWEGKARSGLLRNDPVLSSGLSQIRMALTEQVQGIASQLGLKHLSEIGIVTTKNYMDGGKLELDSGLQGVDRLSGEERLRKAIAQDPEGFYQMFMGGTSESPKAEQGIARRVIGLIDKTIKENIEQRAGNEFRQNHQFTLGRELDNVNKSISNFERRLQQVEQRYWAKFSAMESAISQLNSQSDTLMSQMMSLGGMNNKR